MTDEIHGRIVNSVLDILGQQVTISRHHRAWTTEELAKRAAVTPSTVQAVEGGSPSVEIGIALRIAVECGIELWGTDREPQLARMREAGRSTIALLPAKVHPPLSDDPADFDF